MPSLEYIKHKRIDFDKWDTAIFSSDLPLVFAQSFYLNATCPHWDALILGDYESVFPITYKTRFGFRYLPQPPFTSQLGAFGKVDQDVEKVFHDYILKTFKLIEVELNAGNRLKSEFIVPKKTYIIDYKSDFKFNQNTKRNISKALENELRVIEVPSNEALILSKKIINPFLRKEVALSKETVLCLDRLLVNAIAEGCLKTFKVADNKNGIRALAHFICNGKHALYLKGALVDKGDKSGSMHLLLSHAISVYKDQSIFFDFGGGSGSKGLAGFYEGLGGVPMEYSFLRVNRLPRLIKFLKSKK
ncbi:MAG: hypothetical protein K0R26_618 [Bacteroidota bacterium]|jgi:hypothetical protein|nr:hypothetical protein [Bacteroidota bacterium]